MRKTRTILLEAFLGAVAPLLACGACIQPYVSIDTTAFTFSGCYKETIYAGIYETVVWTIEGRDVADPGTKAISASLVRTVVVPLKFAQEYRQPVEGALCKNRR